MKPVLHEERPNAGREHQIHDGMTLGRQGCDVVLDDPKVSRMHARVRYNGRRVGVEDPGSTNGVLVNGERIERPTELHDGDVLTLGDARLRLELAVQATAVAPVPGTPRAPAPSPEPEPVPDADPVPAPPSEPRDQSALRPTPVPVPDLGGVVGAFQPAGAGSRTRRGSAATRIEATAVSYAVVIATAIAVVAYLAGR